MPALKAAVSESDPGWNGELMQRIAIDKKLLGTCAGAQGHSILLLRVNNL
jgi:hypothetical protein